MKTLVGIIGRKGSGKDTLFKMLTNNLYPTLRLSFGDPIKQVLADRLNTTFEDINSRKNEPEIRKALQKIGEDQTKWNFFIGNKFCSLDFDGTVIITDCRYISNAMVVKQLGGILVRVYRPLVDDADDLHPSEVEMDKIQWDFSIDNGANLGRLQWYAKILARQLKERWGI